MEGPPVKTFQKSRMEHCCQRVDYLPSEIMCYDYLLKILLEEKQKEVEREKMKKTISHLIQDAAIKARKEVRSLIIHKMQNLRPKTKCCLYTLKLKSLCVYSQGLSMKLLM